MKSKRERCHKVKYEIIITFSILIILLILLLPTRYIDNKKVYSDEHDLEFTDNTQENSEDSYETTEDSHETTEDGNDSAIDVLDCTEETLPSVDGAISSGDMVATTAEDIAEEYTIEQSEEYQTSDSDIYEYDNSSSTDITTESSDDTTGHQHTWVAQYTTVHHEEEGHYKEVLVSAAHNEYIYETHNFCNYCGLDITASGQDVGSHCITCGAPLSEDDIRYVPGVITTEGSSYGTNDVVIDTIYHDAVYEKRWIVERPAYDEKVLTGYTCTCGATKSN